MKNIENRKRKDVNKMTDKINSQTYFQNFVNIL